MITLSLGSFIFMEALRQIVLPRNDDVFSSISGVILMSQD